jgi:hypothetical protein
MSTRRFLVVGLVVAGLLGLALVVTPILWAADAPAAPAAPAEKPAAGTAKDKPAEAAKDAPAEATGATKGPNGEKLVPVDIKLPKALFEGTPKNIKPAPTLEKYVDKNRPAFLAPEGTVLLSKGKKVTSSDMEPIIGEIKLIADGDKEGSDGSFVELGPGKQWVQVDLGEPATIYCLVVWHYHGEGRVYHDVVVQVADDADFIENVKTAYNNDFDNSSGLGIGKDLEYIEDYRGRLIKVMSDDYKPVRGRYVRLYSKGNTSNDQNHYIEVEVFGKPAK